MSGFQSNDLDKIKNVANAMQKIMQGSQEKSRELPSTFTDRVPQAHADIQDVRTLEDRNRILGDHIRAASSDMNEIIPTDFAIEFENQVLNYAPEPQEGQDG